jgi:PEGA domain
VAALAVILKTQTDLFDPGRRAAAAQAAEAADKEALARHVASQPVPADITITATEPDAAVWLLLGRTPVDSPALSAAMVHEVRLEHEGYRPHDVRVTGYQWVEDAGSLRATIVAELVPGAPDARQAAASPPAPPASAPAGPRERGVLHVESRPPGAQVWLLVGFTPRATVSGLEAGRDYQLKVLKDGFRPGLAAIRAEEWRPSGPEGPVAASQSRDVALTPVTEGRPGKSRKRRGER